MAEYLPPTEDLPKFNEFVFEDAYSIEGLDRRVVHKAGTETITGQKTFTNDVFLVENSAGADKISVNGTTTTITNTNIKLQAIAGTDVLSITSSQVSSNQNISISKTLPTSTAPVLSISNGQFNSQTPLLTLRYFSGLFSGYGAKVAPSSIQKASYNAIGTETLTDMLNWNSSTGDVSLSANSGSSNVLSLIGTAIDAVSNLYAGMYFLGRSTETNIPLTSMVMGCGVNTVSLPNVGSGATATTDGVWASGGRLVRTPSYGLFYPQFITIQLSGGFTGGTSPTIRVEVMNGSASPDAIIASTGNISYTTGLIIFPTAAASSFTSTSGLGTGVQYYVRYVIVNGTGTAITASTKQAFVQVYGYQTT